MARVYISSVINAPANRVWSLIRNFNGLPDWHPAVAESYIEGGNPPSVLLIMKHVPENQIGAVKLASSGYRYLN